MGASQTHSNPTSLGPAGPTAMDGATQKRMEHKLARRGVDVDTLDFGDHVELAAEFGQTEANRRLEERGGLLARMNASSGLMDRIIGGAFGFVIGIIMLNFLFGLSLVNDSNGTFSEQLTTVEQVIGAAIVLGALGILALAGYYARSMLGGM